MGFTFYRRIRILPWLYLNISKSGISFSVTPRKGASVNLGGKKGPRARVGLPGTGLGYNWSLKGWKDRLLGMFRKKP